MSRAMRASVRDLRAHVPSCQKRTNFSYSNVLTCQRRANFSPWRANVPKGLPSFQLRLPEGLRIFQLFSKELYFFTYLIYLYLICFIYLPTSGIRTVDPPPPPPEENCTPVRVVVLVKVRVSFRVRGQPDNCSGGKFPPG